MRQTITHPRTAPGFDSESPDAQGSIDAHTPAAGPQGDGADRTRALEAELAVCRGMIERIVQVASEAAQGNLEARLLHCNDSEESRQLAHSVNHLLDMADAFLREAGAALEHASHGKFFRRVLTRGMRGTFRHKSQLINEATEKMSRNTASLKEVERLVSDSANLAQTAVREATEAIAVVKRLGEASGKIGDVTKSISEIAWQTKLLAFNAKIEAGRAGEAGRGFDVVAEEVKALAQQTASATDGIAKEIATVREEITRTTHAMDTINKTVGEMQNVAATIERAVVEQSSKKARGNGIPR
jgi:methyl-accepting chemotaxis protein